MFTKKPALFAAMALLGIFLLAWSVPGVTNLPGAGEPDKMDLQSADVITFGPQGILFIGDSKGGAVFAVDVNDNEPAEGSDRVQMQGIDKKVAAMLGTTTDEIIFHDMATHPVSKKIYLSATRGAGEDAQPVLLRVAGEENVEVVSLDNLKFTKASLTNAPAADAKDRRGRSLRGEAITDMSYVDGKLYVAGLSNEEFASNLRRLDFPFNNKMAANSLEIYHAAHGQYETHSPIRTFIPFELEKEPFILASYTCTPLVTFPVKKLEEGGHVKGVTVGEFGSGNRPLDMVAYRNDGKDFVLIANSNRTMMKFNPQDIIGAKSLTEPVHQRYGTAGIEYISIAQVGVLQLADYNESNVIVLKRDINSGALNLQTLPKGRL